MRTLVEFAISMLSDSSLPPSFAIDALQCSGWGFGYGPVREQHYIRAESCGYFGDLQNPE
jgi:hypothetical protein